MKLSMKIHNIKAIKDFEIDFPVDKGLYAITGENGSGKSTVVMCGATVFFQFPMHEYFGKTLDGAYINFSFSGATRRWENQNGRWLSTRRESMNIKGFYEGSLIFGNRFRNNNYPVLKTIDKIDKSFLVEASEFIRSNMGFILHNDRNYYEKLYQINGKKLKELNLYGDIFFYEKNNKIISQLHMSTGENLLVSVLNSLNIRNSERSSLSRPCIFFLDEIEIALHPASLKRLIPFLKEQANEYNYAMYFSTHSIELMSAVKPDNIFYLQRHFDDSIEIINPCYPSYATKILYDHSGYDTVVLVEDDLAKETLTRIIKNYNLINNKLIHVLPCGGWTNVIDLANDVVASNLLGKISKIIIVLDKDIQEKVNPYIKSRSYSFNIPLNFLPVESLEKYLKSNLYNKVNHELYRLLDNYIFNQKSLSEIINEYKTSQLFMKDDNGKKLFGLIDAELTRRNKNRIDIIEIILNFLIKNEVSNVNKIVEFLKKNL